MAARKPLIAPRAADAALLASLDRRIRSEGELSFPAAPALLDLYMRRLASLFASMGKRLSRDELASLRSLLEPRLKDGFEQSPHCRVHIKWQPEEAPGTGVDYRIWLVNGTLEAEYASWASSREPPLFGAYPDAKLLHIARALKTPERHRILDIGAGTGRNTLALARAGYAVHALETTPGFCSALRDTARTERLPIEVIEGNVLAPELVLGRAHYSLVVCSEVTGHFRGPADLRRLFERAARWTRKGGSLLVNAFVASKGFEPSALAREFSQIAWSTVFTHKDLAEAMGGLPFSRISDESAYAYEKAHQPPQGWPPTSWFENWSRGFNCYQVKQGLPPMDLRWLHYRKD
ncbi:MAG TPA: class I SAM-dependent methyltransferase [Polyangiaceae bacterium]|nr:class I SAM-dependent methyltransferase [Polyangiaceae bacterium]